MFTHCYYRGHGSERTRPRNAAWPPSPTTTSRPSAGEERQLLHELAGAGVLAQGVGGDDEQVAWVEAGGAEPIFQSLQSERRGAVPDTAPDRPTAPAEEGVGLAFPGVR